MARPPVDFLPHLLALSRLNVRDMTTPVEGYDGGIPVSAVERGLHFIVDPWGTMNPGDLLQVFWDNNQTPQWSKTIEAGDENNRVVGILDKAHILRGDAFPVFYRVTRAGQSPESSPELNCLVKLDRPGGLDDDQPTPGHSNLKYEIPQDIIDNGVDQQQAALGVPITILPYPFMRVNDRINLAWGSQNVFVKVEQRHIDNPAANPLIITVDPATIERAGDSDGLAVAYQVVDEVGNYPDERAPWSAVTYLLVDVEGNRLDAPIIVEASVPGNVIDLATLGDADVTVLVNTVGGAFAVGDTVSLTWHGTPAEGSPIIVGPIDLTVVRVGIAVTFTIPNAKVKAIAKGRAVVSYLLKRAGAEDQPSKNTGVSVEGEISRLPAPSVAQARAGQLPADSPFATVSVPYYEGRSPGDYITVRWEGTLPGGGSTYFSAPIIVGNEPVGTPLERNVPGTEIAQLDGGTVKIHYTVANDGFGLRSVRESLPLDLSVGQARPQLQQPEVPQAINNVLLPENVPNGANVIAPYTGTLPGDSVGLRWKGSVSGDRPPQEFPLNSHTAGKPVPFLVESQYISSNLNGTVQLDYYVKRTGQPTVYSLPRVLRIGAAQVAVPRFTNAPYRIAPQGRLKDIVLLLASEEGVSVPDAALTLTLPSGFIYADGGTGAREFVTGVDGTVKVGGVKGHGTMGDYELTVEHGTETVSAPVSIAGLGPIGTIRVGDIPYSVAISPDGTRAYVSNFTSNTVTVIDTETNQPVANIQAGESPYAIATSPNGTRVYVGNQTDSTISVIDTATNAVVTHVQTRSSPLAIVISPDSTRAYVGGGDFNTVTVINLVTNEVLRSIPVGSSPYGLAISPDSRHVYVCNLNSHMVSVIDTAMDEVLQVIPVAAAPFRIAVSPDGTRAYVAHHSGTVTVVDTVRNTVLKSIATNGSPLYGVAVSPNGKYVYVSNNPATLTVINTATNEVRTNIPVEKGPYGITISPDGNRVYTAHYVSGVISVIAGIA